MGCNSLNIFISISWDGVDRKVATLRGCTVMHIYSIHVFHLMASDVTNQSTHVPTCDTGYTSLSSYESTGGAMPLVYCHNCFVIYTVSRVYRYSPCES